MGFLCDPILLYVLYLEAPRSREQGGANRLGEAGRPGDEAHNGPLLLTRGQV